MAAVVLGSLFCSICGTVEAGCSVRYQTAWVAVLHHLVLACWQLVPAYLCENSMCCAHLFQLVASVWPLFCVIAR
jgi:hypothetical protein